MLDSKECFKCKSVKPLAMFYKHRGMLDGHLNKCVECTKIDVTRNRKENLERVRQYDCERGKLPHRKKLTSLNTRLKRKEVVGYGSAHCKVLRAIKNGDLIKKPCCMCGSIMVHAHHDDYLAPLDVMWLCAIHHKSRHAYLKYIAMDLT